MHMPAPKKDKNRESGTVDLTKALNRQNLRRSGGGRHQDGRLTRNRTRSRQTQRALGEW